MGFVDAVIGSLCNSVVNNIPNCILILTAAAMHFYPLVAKIANSHGFLAKVS